MATKARPVVHFGHLPHAAVPSLFGGPMLGQGVRIQSISLAAYRPPPARPFVRRPHVGQLVSVSPNVQVSVNTGIEQYLFPVGLMAGGGAMFVLGTTIPDKLRFLTTLAGLGLLATGVGVLIYRGTKGGGAAAAPAAPPPPSGGVPVDSSAPSAPAFQPPTVDSFRSLQLQVVSPQPDQSISHSGGFLGFGSKTIPVQLRMFNPSGDQITFNLDFTWDEFPAFTGYDRGQYHGSTSFQVTLGANEEKNQTFDLPMQTDVSWTQMQVDMQIYKKRTPDEVQQMLSNITFTVT